MNVNYFSTKTIELGSCAFRQPYADSHCKFLHGYRLTAKFVFGCNNLDNKNWVVDFGGLKELKNILEHQFDHTTVVWEKDPQIELFKMLNERGVVDLRVMQNGVGIEKFAEYCFDIAHDFISKNTSNRCWVESVEIWEHDKNSAFVTRCNATYAVETPKTEQLIVETPKTEEVKTNVEAKKEEVKKPVAKQLKKNPPAPVGNKLDTSNHLGFKKVLDGVKWGSQSR